jgi:hypothetical protein
MVLNRKSPPLVFQPWGTWIEKALSRVSRTVIHFVPVAPASICPGTAASTPFEAKRCVDL